MIGMMSQNQSKKETSAFTWAHDQRSNQNALACKTGKTYRDDQGVVET